MNELNEVNRYINRHKARILSNLEDAGCPVVFVDAVSGGLSWLRTDVIGVLEGTKGDYNDHRNEETDGNR